MSLELVSAGEFLDSLPEKLPYVIEPLCMRGSSVMLYGRQKIGKSSAIMQLIHSLTTGEPWMGFPVRQTGNVLYLQLDMAQLELARVMKRAETAGLRVRERLFVPRPPKGEHRVQFDILRDDHMQDLTALCARIEPVAVIVDTINDAYTAIDKGDVNAFIREIHRRFMVAIGDAALIFLNHKRKQMQKFKPSDEDDDEDGYLGGSAWAGVVAANLELTRSRSDHQPYLVLRDLRLDSYPAKRVPLKKDENGFFEAVLNSQQMLAIWPDNLQPDERDTIRASLMTYAEVFRDIAARTGSTPEAVKKQYQRAQGAEFPWEAIIREHNAKT